jgi:hypothetical protein
MVEGGESGECHDAAHHSTAVSVGRVVERGCVCISADTSAYRPVHDLHQAHGLHATVSLGGHLFNHGRQRFRAGTCDGEHIPLFGAML